MCICAYSHMQKSLKIQSIWPQETGIYTVSREGWWLYYLAGNEKFAYAHMNICASILVIMYHVPHIVHVSTEHVRRQSILRDATVVWCAYANMCICANMSAYAHMRKHEIETSYDVNCSVNCICEYVNMRICAHLFVAEDRSDKDTVSRCWVAEQLHMYEYAHMHICENAFICTSLWRTLCSNLGDNIE